MSYWIMLIVDTTVTFTSKAGGRAGNPLGEAQKPQCPMYLLLFMLYIMYISEAVNTSNTEHKVLAITQQTN